MKEEMQGFHMTPNFEIYISEITLFWPDYTSIRVGPRMWHFITKILSANFIVGSVFVLGHR